MGSLTRLWVYLAQTPLLWLTVTVAVYAAAHWLHQRAHARAILNPVLIAVAVIVAILLLTGTSYETYFDGAQFAHFLLGPATVALAVPLYAQLGKLRRLAVPVGVSLLAGSITAIVSAGAICWALGASRQTILSILPKSATTPIAMGVSEGLGGLPSLTAVLVILTGILGAVAGTAVLDALRVRDEAARGFALGVASHGIGTARAFQVSEETGAFAGLAMGLNGALTAVLVPFLAGLFGL
ncbi:MAG TPA: LrgB family protein [Thermoflexales bacterium]|mgnify:FL=1|nr:LrgB family protein [Thermoflexales bacterium]HQY23644.1 LrgB family protein [Thermoflexales bacterium]HQZ54977.1 LrgB family protein [Thermoflexales bacterium]HRA52696.1 LrgB family protein [Thermoflexales bacterium]